MKEKPQPLRDGGRPPARIAVGLVDQQPPKPPMLPVWFFIGIILFIYGVLIFVSGLYEISHPPLTVLQDLHAPIWWGAIMAVVGVVYVAKNRHP